MLSRKQKQFLRSLQSKKHRQEVGKFLIEGIRLIGEGLQSKFPIESIWMTQEKQNTDSGKKILKDARNLNIPIETTSPKSLDMVSNTQHNQGVLAIAGIPDYSRTKFDNYILALDSISDPGNMGTLLRSAVWFGIKTVLLSENSVDPFNPKVVRGGMGAHFLLKNINTVILEDTLPQFRKNGYSVIGADISGVSLNELKLDIKQNWVLVVGNEAHGISESVRHSITHMVSIPGKGKLESLNAAVAGGILLEKLTV